MGKGVAIAIVAVVVIIVVFLVYWMRPGLAGTWEEASHSTTTTFGNTHITSWNNDTDNWVELRDDGTGTTNAGGEFDWETVDGQLRISGDFIGSTSISMTFDYELDGNELTISYTGPLGAYHEITYHRA
jgi:hypothetical protein